MGGYKQERIGGRIRTIVSEMIVRQVRDPRLHGVTITEVDVDPEYMSARIYVNALGEEERAPEVMLALNKARSFFRREVARRLNLRRAPELFFKWDSSLARSDRINTLLASLDIPTDPDDPQETRAMAIRDLQAADEDDYDDYDDYDEDEDADDADDDRP